MTEKEEIERTESVIEAKNKGGNREHKSDVFSMLMEDPWNALDVYNALNGSSYEDPAMVEILQLDHGISLSMRNDAAFIIDCQLNIYEHQSTWNPNMPLRGVYYYAILYRRYEKKHNLNVYGSAPLKLPMPVYVVFCNSVDMTEARVELRLTDLFPDNGRESACLECIAHVININRGYNDDIVNGCQRLYEYVQCIETIRSFSYGISSKDSARLSERIEQAIDVCIEKGYLADILEEERSAA